MDTDLIKVVIIGIAVIALLLAWIWLAWMAVNWIDVRFALGMPVWVKVFATMFLIGLGGSGVRRGK